MFGGSLLNIHVLFLGVNLFITLSRLEFNLACERSRMCGWAFTVAYSTCLCHSRMSSTASRVQLSLCRSRMRISQGLNSDNFVVVQVSDWRLLRLNFGEARACARSKPMKVIPIWKGCCQCLLHFIQLEIFQILLLI